MGRMPRLVERGKKERRLGEPREVSWEEIEVLELDPRVELIRQLIPLGLAEVGRMLEEEVEQLAGQRHARKTEDDRHYRHGHNPRPAQHYTYVWIHPGPEAADRRRSRPAAGRRARGRH